MEWARILAYITGTADPQLLLCNGYMATLAGDLREAMCPPCLDSRR